MTVSTVVTFGAQLMSFLLLGFSSSLSVFTGLIVESTNLAGAAVLKGSVV